MRTTIETVADGPGNIIRAATTNALIAHDLDHEARLTAVTTQTTSAFNVRSYGAKGDGVTDDTAAVQSALTAAATAGGGTVYVPAGTYQVGGLVMRNSITLRGDGWGSTLRLRGGANTYLLTVARADTSQTVTDCRIQDLKFDGNCYSQRSGGGINLVFASSCVIDHVNVVGPWHAGLLMTANPDGSAWPYNNTISNCLFNLGKNSPDAAHSGYGLDLGGGEENDIRGNTFGFNGVAHITEGVVGNNTISDNTFVNGQIGILSNGSRGRWLGNSFDRLAGHCFRVIGNSNMISGNACFEIGVDGPAGTASAVALDWGATSNLVTGNVFITSSTPGRTRSLVWEMFDNTRGNVIANNTFQVNGSTARGTVETSSVSNTYRGNDGYNPVGALPTPVLPVSGSAHTNQSSHDATVYVHGGTVSAIAVAGMRTGLTSGAFRVVANQTITLTYTAAPAWTWIGD